LFEQSSLTIEELPGQSSRKKEAKGPSKAQKKNVKTVGNIRNHPLMGKDGKKDHTFFGHMAQKKRDWSRSRKPPGRLKWKSRYKRAFGVDGGRSGEGNL